MRGSVSARLKPKAEPEQGKPFNLPRWFAVLASLVIAGVCGLIAPLLAQLFAERMLTRDGELTAGFVEALARVNPPDALFLAIHIPAKDKPLPEFFRHIAELEDTLRINAYNRDHMVVWSSDAPMIGRRFPDNEELNEALGGHMVVHTGEASVHPKPEHVNLRAPGGPFVENYLPVRSIDRGGVIGVIEVYRVPTLLFDSIATGQRLIWGGALLAALALFAMLYWAVHRADQLMSRQREQLLEAQTLATVGELSRAVAHSVRNPLAAIRSSAELELQVQEGLPSRLAEAMRDIVGLVDRIDGLLTDMLALSAPGAGSSLRGADLGRVVRRTLDAFAQEFKRQRIELRSQMPRQMPPVDGDERLLAQALASLMSNAMEAMPDGGRLEVAVEPSDDRRLVRLTISDSGLGMGPEQVARAFDPFYTNKARGLGIGLALVKRIVELSRGQITLTSQPGRGTTVSVVLRTA